MKSLADALAAANLISRTEAAALSKPSDSLEGFRRQWKSRPIEERLKMTIGFLPRIREAIESIEEGGSLDSVLAWAQKHLTGGDAGKQFCIHLIEVKSGAATIADVRGRWLRAFV